MSHGIKGHTEEDGLSTAMRLLLHYIGDIHQPLHATSRVDSSYPAGDRGGNEFPLPSVDGAKNLHAVWDSVAYEFTNDYKLPFSESDWKKIGEQAETLVAKHDISESVFDELDFTKWAQESFEISESFVYKGK